MNKIFIDTDVILDVLLSREPYQKAATFIFQQIELKNVLAYTSPIVMANIHYIISKATSHTVSLEKIKKLHQLLHISTIDQEIMDLVVSDEKIKDYEDLIQYYSAIRAGTTFLITRNISDYPKTKKIKIIDSESFSNLLRAQLENEERPE